jgi:hypothetical protein
MKLQMRIAQLPIANPCSTGFLKVVKPARLFMQEKDKVCITIPEEMLIDGNFDPALDGLTATIVAFDDDAVDVYLDTTKETVSLPKWCLRLLPQDSQGDGSISPQYLPKDKYAL